MEYVDGVRMSTLHVNVGRSYLPKRLSLPPGCWIRSLKSGTLVCANMVTSRAALPALAAAPCASCRPGGTRPFGCPIARVGGCTCWVRRSGQRSPSAYTGRRYRSRPRASRSWSAQTASRSSSPICRMSRTDNEAAAAEAVVEPVRVRQDGDRRVVLLLKLVQTVFVLLLISCVTADPALTLPTIWTAGPPPRTGTRPPTIMATRSTIRRPGPPAHACTRRDPAVASAASASSFH